ncbi:hypothetical protein [Bernardetia sp. MNP-M8]|uniref:hypothetical protein n=1 Tax=Bernardetia sp. MNP-M8 TaxID=3127470 RepID=UPI0030CBA4B4
MNKIYVLILMSILFFSCSNKRRVITDSSLESSKNQNIDSIFFKAPDIFEYKDWLLSDAETANILRIVNQDTIKDYFWAEEGNNLMHLKLLAEGKGIYPKSMDEKNAKLFGQWKYYGDADIGLYKIGFFSNGFKDSVWYINYEDFPIPLIKFYKQGKSIDYRAELVVYSDTLLLAKGREVKANGLPIGEWIFDNRQFKYTIREERDSILIYSPRNKEVIRLRKSAIDEL